MKKNFSEMTLLDAMSYLEELDYYASVLNKDTIDLLNKERLNNKISKDVYKLLSNTLKSIKEGRIKINGETLKLYETSDDSHTNFIIDVDVEEAKKIKTEKDLDNFFTNLTDWEANNYNSYGTTYSPLSEKGDNCTLKLKEKIIVINDTEYKLGTDFNYLLNVYNKGIYVLKEVKGVLQGITIARWEI